MTAADIRYGRRGGGWTTDTTAGHRLNGPACDECGRPMLCRQRRRHATCSPLCPCGCGHHVDLCDPGAEGAHPEHGRGGARDPKASR